MVVEDPYAFQAVNKVNDIVETRIPREPPVLKRPLQSKSGEENSRDQNKKQIAAHRIAE